MSSHPMQQSFIAFAAALAPWPGCCSCCPGFASISVHTMGFQVLRVRSSLWQQPPVMSEGVGTLESKDSGQAEAAPTLQPELNAAAAASLPAQQMVERLSRAVLGVAGNKDGFVSVRREAKVLTINPLC